MSIDLTVNAWDAVSFTGNLQTTGSEYRPLNHTGVKM